MANHEGAGDGLRATAFDLPRILHTFFRLKKYVAEGLLISLKLKDKSDKKTTPATGSISKKGLVGERSIID